NRRYDTANGLARDIERYLAQEPIEARPPSARYKMRKLAAKNRKLLATLSGFVLLLIVGAVVSAWQAARATSAEHQAIKDRDAKEAALQAEAEHSRRAEEAKRRAGEESAIANSVNEFLQDLLGHAYAGRLFGDVPRNPKLTVREVLDQAAENIDSKFK